MSQKENRRCSKCGVTQLEDTRIPYFCFIQPGKTNLLQARAWAIYCWPDQPWLSVAGLKKLGRSHKLLCGRHFDPVCFSDKRPNKLQKFAIPGDKAFREQNSKLRCELYLMKNDAFDEDWSGVLQQLPQLQDHDYIPSHLQQRPNDPGQRRRQKLSVVMPLIPAVKQRDAEREPGPSSRQVPLAPALKISANNASASQHLHPDPDKTDTIITKYEHESDLHESNQKTTKTLDAGREVDDECDDLEFDDFSPKRPKPLSPSENINEFDTANDIVVNSTNIDSCNPINDENELFNDLSSKIPKDDDVMLVGEEDEDVYTLLNTKSEIPEDSGGDGDDDHYIPQEHHGFCCNVCLGKIVGFRYRCCECEDYDMCSDCESRQQHPQHYVLRVPGYRKQAEVRGVIAALRLGLAPPNDVKDELIIKIEDQEQEHSPDPLDTSDADPPESADTEPMETDNSAPSDPSVPLDSLASDHAPPSAKKPRIMPNKDNTTYKVVGIHTRQLPALMDALRKKAIVRLEKMVMPFRENPIESACMESLRPVKQTTEEPTKQLTDRRYLPILPKPSEPQKKHEATLFQNIAGKPENITAVKSVDEVTDLNAANVQYMTVEDFNTLMAQKVDNTVMCNDASSQEEVYHMTVEDFNTLMARRDNIVQCDYESVQEGHMRNVPVEDFSALIAQKDDVLVCNDEFHVYPSVRSKNGS